MTCTQQHIDVHKDKIENRIIKQYFYGISVSSIISLLNKNHTEELKCSSSHDLNGMQTHNPLACGIAPQSTILPCAPTFRLCPVQISAGITSFD
jgi:hypothetical protein